MGINFWDPNNQNQDQGQGQGEGQGQLSLQGQGQAQAQIAADLNGNLNGNGNGNLNGNGNFNADGNLNGNLNDNVNHNTDTVCVDVSVDASVTPLIGDLSDATALYMPQDIAQSFTAGGTDTAIALDQINSLVANNLAPESTTPIIQRLPGSGATDPALASNISQGDLATGQLQGATSAAATVDAFTQSIVLGANIQNNSFTLAITGHAVGRDDPVKTAAHHGYSQSVRPIATACGPLHPQLDGGRGRGWLCSRFGYR